MNEAVYQFIKETFRNSFDVKYREIVTDKGVINIIYIDNMCDAKFISEFIIAPLSNARDKIGDIIDIKKGILSVGSIGVVKNKDELITHLLSGDVVIIFSFLKEIVFCDAKGFAKRSVTTPLTEGQIKGPREGLTEVLADNISLIRRRVKDPDLKFENITLGRKTKTMVVISYIENTAPRQLIEYIKKQLNSIDENAILNSNYIEEKLKCKHTAFDTIGFTEKPDVASSRLCEGRVIIMVDGTPFVITAPYFFFEGIQAGDDYYNNKYFGNATRILRWIAFALAILLPSFYIAIVTHHFSLIPYAFTFRLAVSRAGVPFPTVIEVLLLAFFFQLSREAGIRLPQPVGQAMSIVGALILGDATVGSGLASQTTLIIVAISSICSFLVPKLYPSIALWNLVLIPFSAALGLPGFYIGFCVLVSHIAGLNSCGYPYLFPLGTLRSFGHKDILIRGDLYEVTNNIFKEEEKN
jgi:hypothetical protein